MLFLQGQAVLQNGVVRPVPRKGVGQERLGQTRLEKKASRSGIGAEVQVIFAGQFDTYLLIRCLSAP